MLKTFRLGGVHPHDHKISKDAAIRIFDVPKTVTIPLGQHIGAPATAAVKKGDKVLVFHKKRRKGYRKLNGHRQQFTELTIKQVIA